MPDEIKHHPFRHVLKMGNLMKRRHLSAFRASVAALALLATIPTRAEPPERDERIQDTHRIGMSQLRGGKDYADMPMRAVHDRLAGPDDGSVIVRLHQTPRSTISYGEAQARLATRFVREANETAKPE